MVSRLRIGVLAMQGAFREHRKALELCGADAIEIRQPLDREDPAYRGLDSLDGLVLPGGESTVIGRLLDVWNLAEAIKACAQRGMPIFGTCAGLILLCREIEDQTGAKLRQPVLGLLNARARRNAFGRQTDSFETKLSVLGVAEDFHAVFIRGPLIVSTGLEVEVLASLEVGDARMPVAVRQDNLLAACFHPELTNDLRFHQFFLDMCMHWRCSLQKH